MRVVARRVIDQPVERVWELVSDPARYPSFMADADSFEPTGWPSTGVGARYSYRMRTVGSAIGGVMEVVENRPGQEFAMASVTGIEQRCRWALHPVGQGQTEVVLRVFFHAASGLVGLVADQLLRLVVRRRARQTLSALEDVLSGQPAPERSAGGGGLVDQLGTGLRGIAVLARSRVIAPVRPDRLVGVARALLHWSFSVAAGYAAGRARHPERAAIVDDRGELTFAEVDQRTDRLANGLSALGVEAGDAVAVLCRNHRGLIETMVACAKLGANTVLLNTSASPAQLAGVLREQSVRLAISDAEFRPNLARSPRGVKRVTAWHDQPTKSTTLDQLIADHPGDVPASPPSAGRLIVMTSGTTGTPKGARRPEPGGLGVAASFLSRIPLRQGERILVPAPLFHTWGLAAVQIGEVLGATLVLPRRFDPESTLDLIERQRCTALFAVPVMLQRILELPTEVIRRYDTSALRIVASSGSALPGQLATEFQREFGPVLYNLYGSTEVSWASVATPTDLRAAPGTAGRPPLGTRLAILDEAGQPVPDGDIGRIFVANDMLFDGYTNGTGKDVHDGLMSTGDLGYLDPSGLLFVAGRDDDMIVSGGENVYPRELEDLLAALPEVREVCVVGVVDPEFGHRLAAYLVLAAGAALDADAVRAHVRANLARFSVPRDVVFLETLPRNATGKVVKRQLPSPS